MRTFNQREKLLIKILITVIVLAFAYFAILRPVINLVSKGDSDSQDAAKQIALLDSVYDEYKNVRQKKMNYATMLSSQNENISSQIEQWANSANISKNIAYTRRSQSNLQNKYVKITTNMKIDGVAIQPLLQFLYDIESSNKLIVISNITINQGLKGTNLYDVLLKIDSFVLQQ